jgi:hypothetical protein
VTVIRAQARMKVMNWIKLIILMVGKVMCGAKLVRNQVTNISLYLKDNVIIDNLESIVKVLSAVIGAVLLQFFTDQSNLYHT